MGVTDRMINDFAGRLKSQTTYKVLTYLEVREKTGKNTDPNFVRCYYPDRDTPSMLTVYFRVGDTQIVGRKADLDDYSSPDATKKLHRDKNLIVFIISESADSTHSKTLNVVLEIIEHVGKKRGYVTAPIEPVISPEIRLRRDDIFECVRASLEDLPVSVRRYGPDITVMFQDWLICGVSVLDETYKLYNISKEWKTESKYKCEESKDGTFYCFVDTIDECIGQVDRLVHFEAKKGPAK